MVAHHGTGAYTHLRDEPQSDNLEIVMLRQRNQALRRQRTAALWVILAQGFALGLVSALAGWRFLVGIFHA